LENESQFLRFFEQLMEVLILYLFDLPKMVDGRVHALHRLHLRLYFLPGCIQGSQSLILPLLKLVHAGQSKVVIIHECVLASHFI
jgi:hypothetical protein